jgi:AraC-like DNA-binding protein
MAMRNVTQQAQFLNRIGDFECFKLLLDTLPDTAFFIKDIKGCVVLFNRRSCEVYNVDHESEILGKTDYDLHPKPLADKYTHDDCQVMRTRKPIINATELAPNDSNRLVVYSKVPVFDRKKKVIGVAGIYRFIDDVSDTPDWHGRFSDVIAYIHDSYPKSIRLDDLAQRMKTSTRQLERRFIKIFGIGIVDYILRVRINAARELLETTNRTVSDIALAVGFYDHSHFIRTFKRLRGCSPKQYRARHAISIL